MSQERPYNRLRNDEIMRMRANYSRKEIALKMQISPACLKKVITRRLADRRKDKRNSVDRRK